jgi:hypothetical protein
MVFNKDYESIITNGLVLNLDAGFIPSYQGSGTTWYDLAYSGYNLNLTNAPTYSSDGGGSILFDGVDDRAIGSTITTYTNTQTWTAWVKRTSSFNLFNMFMGRFLPYFAFRSDGLFHFSNQIGGTQRNLYSLQTYSNNVWYFTSFTTEYQNPNTIMKMYINGSLVNSNAFSGTQNNYSINFTVGDGRNTSTWYPFNGYVSMVSVYNRTLSSDEILQNYNAGLARFNTSNIVKNGLVLNLDSSNTVSYPTSGTTWTDLSGNGYHGTLINGPTFDSTSKSIVFDGTNDYVSCGTQIGNFGTSNFAINFLFKTGEQSAPSTFVAKSIGSSPTSDYGWLVNNGSDGTNLGFAIASANVNWGTNGSYVIQTSGATINNNTWQMATIVGDRSQPNVSIYLNGVLQNLKSYVATTAPFTSLGNVTNDKIFAIGSESDISSSPFPIEANIEALRIYDRSLSQSEVLQNYYQAPIVTSGLVMALDAGNLVSYPGSGTSWRDLTTNGNNGTLTNGPTFSSLNGGYIVFDGSDDWVQIPTYTFGNGNWSVNVWVNADSLSNFNLISNSSGGPVTNAFGFDSNKIFYRNYNGNWQGNVGNTILSTNTWYMLTWVNYAGASESLGTMQMFVNGISDSSTFNSYTTNGGPCNAIGRNWFSNFSGEIGNVQFYNKSLTLSEVAQNYNAQKSRFGL